MRSVIALLLAGLATAGELQVAVTVQLVAPPEIVSATTADHDGDGRIDRLIITFSSPVDVHDPQGTSDGLSCIELNGGRSIAAGAYDATGTTSLTLAVVPSEQFDTDILVSATYRAGMMSSITAAGTPVGLANGSTGSATDGAAPAVVLSSALPTVFTTTPFLVQARFSEPVPMLLGSGCQVLNGTISSIVRTGPDAFTITVEPVNPGTVDVSLSGSSVIDAAGNPARASSVLRRIWMPASAANQCSVAMVTLSGQARGPLPIVRFDGQSIPIVNGAWSAAVSLSTSLPASHYATIEFPMPEGEPPLQREVEIHVESLPAGGGG
jgi:hypothetical protein